MLPTKALEKEGGYPQRTFGLVPRGLEFWTNRDRERVLVIWMFLDKILLPNFLISIRPAWIVGEPTWIKRVRGNTV